MIDIRPVLFVVGLLLATLGVFMLLPAIVDVAYSNSDWKAFAFAAGATIFIGVVLALSNRVRLISLSVRQAFLLTTVAWISVAAFAALPFVFADLRLGIADAFFESMSGLTTTGSTVMSNLDMAPPGILLWRSLLQWLGGIGIIVMAVAMLPLLKVGGMQLFRSESSDVSDKSLPRVARIAVSILVVYVGLTVFCAAALMLSGIGGFDAIAHAMTTISTGGYSTHDASVGYFNSAAAEWIIVFFMFCGAIPFVLYIRVGMGHLNAISRDSQVRAFLGMLALCWLALAAWLWSEFSIHPLDALRMAAFNVTSIITTTGFTSSDYSLWGSFPVVAFFVFTFIGGCTGSTSGGIKIFRFEVMGRAMYNHIWRLAYPNVVRSAVYGGRAISLDVVGAVQLFMLSFLLTVFVFSLMLGAMGLDLVTAVTAAATAVANVGPGLGEIIGPAGNFASLPNGAKWVLSAAMLLGRLELFTVLVLLAPAYWRG